MGAPVKINELSYLEHVRTRPAMYVGMTDGSGIAHLLWELVDRSINEHLCGHGSKTEIELHPDGSISVSGDDQSSLLEEQEGGVSKAETLLTTYSFPPKNPPSATRLMGYFSQGITLTNFLSEWLEVEIRRDGRAWRQSYRQGKPQGPLAAVGAADGTGTSIRFKPDETLFRGVLRLKPAMLKPRLVELSALFTGLTFVLIHGKRRQTFHQPEGISALVRDLCQGQPVLLEHPVQYRVEGPANGGETISVDVAMQWLARTPAELYGPLAIGFTNGHKNVDGGTHIAGIRTGLLHAMRELLSRQGKVDRKSWPRVAPRMLARTVFVVAARHPAPVYRSRTAGTIANEDMKALARRGTRLKLLALLAEQPDLLASLV